MFSCVVIFNKLSSELVPGSVLIAQLKRKPRYSKHFLWVQHLIDMISIILMCLITVFIDSEMLFIW